MNRKKILIPIIIITVIVIVLLIIFNSNHRFKKLSVSQGKWDSLISSRNKNSDLRIESIQFNEFEIIIDEVNNTLYYSVVNDSKNKYNPNVTYKANKPNTKIAILSDEITAEKVANKHVFKIMVYNTKAYHIYDLVCTNLPIVSINYNEEVAKNSKKIPMKIYVFNNLSNVPNKVTISEGKLKIDDEKYNFSLHMITPGNNIRDNELSLLNMNPNSDYILSKIDENSKGQRVELFINNDYKGLYSLDIIKKEKKNVKENNN